MKRLMLVIVVTLLLVPATGEAAYPGANGKIAFVRGDEIWSMNPNGTGQVNLTNSPGTFEYNPVWSPDGNSIAFQRGGEIWTMLADGTAQVNVTGSAPRPGGKNGPSWSPDGQQLSYAIDGRCETGGPDFENGGVWVIGAAGGTATQIGCVFDGDDRGYESTAWSPDGSTIVFHANLGKQDLYKIPATTTGSLPHAGTNLIGAGFNSIIDDNPNWAPDATKIGWDSDVISTAPQTIWKMNPDGTGKARITSGNHSERQPAWSPDGTKVVYWQDAFVDPAGIYIANADGTSPTFITDGDAPDWQPLNSPGPEADVLSTVSDSPDPVLAGGILTYTGQAKNLVGPDDASGVTLTMAVPVSVFFISATPTQGSCSYGSNLITCNLGNLAVGSSATVTVQVEPQTPGTLNPPVNVSANELDPVPGNNTSHAPTTVALGGYARMKGATPIRVALVPAFRGCDSGQATLMHGPPLAHPSCASPVLTSGHLTVGATPANSSGFVKLEAIGEGPPIDPNNGDQSDVGYYLTMTDVRKATDNSDYTGELQVQATLRLTDRENSFSGNAPATMSDTAISFNAPCTATPSTTVGATCSVATTADALVPNTVKERNRESWELGKLRVLDGGADGDTDTGPNTLFATQGVFVP